MFLFIENDIDGAALAKLPEDFVEFSHLVPRSGLRIKLKPHPSWRSCTLQAQQKLIGKDRDGGRFAYVEGYLMAVS